MKIPDHQLLPADRKHHWLAVAAYYKSEERGFEPGKELDDWLNAEIEYQQYQIQSFFLQCKEDGGISMAGLQGLGRNIGINHPEQFNSKIKLIREIQKITSHRPCFQTRYGNKCGEAKCQWQAECRKLIAAWIR